MAYFQAEAGKGVVVRWPSNPATYTYRWGADGGKYDVEVIAGTVDRASTAKYTYVVRVSCYLCSQERSFVSAGYQLFPFGHCCSSSVRLQ
jgi:hypothetical protein